MAVEKYFTTTELGWTNWSEHQKIKLKVNRIPLFDKLIVTSLFFSRFHNVNSKTPNPKNNVDLFSMKIFLRVYNKHVKSFFALTEKTLLAPQVRTVPFYSPKWNRNQKLNEYLVWKRTTETKVEYPFDKGGPLLEITWSIVLEQAVHSNKKLLVVIEQ